MKGLILTNAHTHYEDIDYQPKRLKEEFEKLNVDVDVMDNNFFPVIINEGKKESNLNEYSFCVYLDKDINTVKLIEKANVRCFNCADAIYLCDSKALTHIALLDQDILMPKTLIAPKIYNEKEQIQEQYLINIESNMEYPFVVKVSQSSQGMGVYLVNNKKELVDIINKNKTKEMIFQEYVEDAYGKDTRVIVIGNKCIGAINRINKNDFRSNLTNGGISQKVEVDDNIKNIAEKVSKILNLDYAGLDFLISKDKVYLCEVNSNAFFKGFEKTTNINVAKLFAQHILNVIK